MKKLYVGNLPYSATEDDVLHLFSEYGEVASCTIIRDKFDNSSKGYGFVELAEEQSALDAVQALDGTEFQGRSIKVNEAREKRSGGGGGRSFGGGGGNGGNGGGFKKRRW